MRAAALCAIVACSDATADCSAGLDGVRANPPDRRGVVQCRGCTEHTLAYCFDLQSMRGKQHQWHSICSPTAQQCIARQVAYGDGVVCPCVVTSGSYYLPNI